MAIVAAGIVVGVIASLAAGRAARSLLEGVLFDLSPTDPRILLSAATTILIIAALASFLPAIRAAHVDSAAAVRAE
jgi:hypothetical protein